MIQTQVIQPRQIPVINMSSPYIKELSVGSLSGHCGFAIGGSAPGPNIIVAGHSALTGKVFQRLLLLPTLSRLRGQLFLVQLDKSGSMDAYNCLPTLLAGDPVIDGQMFLPFVNVANMTPVMEDDAVKDAYWAILRLCADKGMISGRGIPEKLSTLDAPIVWRSSRSPVRQQ